MDAIFSSIGCLIGGCVIFVILFICGDLIYCSYYEAPVIFWLLVFFAIVFGLNKLKKVSDSVQKQAAQTNQTTVIDAPPSSQYTYTPPPIVVDSDTIDKKRL